MSPLHPEHLLNWIFPRRCPICGDVLPPTATASVCSDCRFLLQQEADIPCPICHHPARQCACVPTFLQSEAVPVLTTGFYQPRECPAHAKLIYTLKHTAENTAAQICARSLSSVFLHWCASRKLPSDAWIFTYPPRSAESRSTYGFDQSERLARLCSRNCDGIFVNLFHRHGGDKQKQLHTQQRLENASHAITLRRHPDLSGQSVVVIDDILTTGATTARCAALLKEIGVSRILILSVLKTPGSPPKNASVLWFQS